MGKMLEMGPTILQWKNAQLIETCYALFLVDVTKKG